MGVEQLQGAGQYNEHALRVAGQVVFDAVGAEVVQLRVQGADAVLFDVEQLAFVLAARKFLAGPLISMKLARRRREVRAMVRAERTPPPARDDFGAVLKFLYQAGEEPYRERYKLELLRQTGKRRKPMLRCKCGATKRKVGPQNSIEATLVSSDDWSWSMFSGWQCKACRDEPRKFVNYAVPVVGR